jgi:hypothetical protein
MSKITIYCTLSFAVKKLGPAAAAAAPGPVIRCLIAEEYRVIGWCVETAWFKNSYRFISGGLTIGLVRVVGQIRSGDIAVINDGKLISYSHYRQVTGGTGHLSWNL